MVKCLEQFAETFGAERQVSVSRELTKKFEQTVRGTVAEVLEYFRATEPGRVRPGGGRQDAPAPRRGGDGEEFPEQEND